MDVIICLANRSWKQITVPRICSPFIAVMLSSYDLVTRDLRAGGLSWGVCVYTAAGGSIN